MTSDQAMSAVESILEDVDALIGSFLDVGEHENAQALAEEFKEWFIEYDFGKQVNITTMKVL